MIVIKEVGETTVCSEVISGYGLSQCSDRDEMGMFKRLLQNLYRNKTVSENSVEGCFVAIGTVLESHDKITKCYRSNEGEPTRKEDSDTSINPETDAEINRNRSEQNIGTENNDQRQHFFSRLNVNSQCDPELL